MSEGGRQEYDEDFFGSPEEREVVVLVSDLLSELEAARSPGIRRAVRVVRERWGLGDAPEVVRLEDFRKG